MKDWSDVNHNADHHHHRQVQKYLNNDAQKYLDNDDVDVQEGVAGEDDLHHRHRECHQMVGHSKWTQSS